MKIKSKILLPHIYLLTFPTQYELCMSFVRIQEFYESDSPRFRGKYFTLEEYIDYWSLKHGKGSFTYPSVWNGFNIPGKVIVNWFNKFHDERDREISIEIEIGRLMGKEFGNVESISEHCNNLDKIYVIGVQDGGDKSEMVDAIEHETAHALYCLYPEYKNSCKKLLKKVSKRKYNIGKRVLLNMGYCESVIDDELQAYYSTSVVDGDIGSTKEFIDNFKAFKKKLTKKAGK